jgi:pyruvate ferredoxin oxidoreductase alpha subunit
MGSLGMPGILNELKKAQDEAVINYRKVVLEVWKDWEKAFGRKYEPIMSYGEKGADLLLLTMGSMSETAAVAVDEMQEKGMSVGLLDLKLWRPFPSEEFKKAIKGAKALCIMDRAVSYGGTAGPVCAEIKALLYDEPDAPAITNYIIGLGGRDVAVPDFIKMAEEASKAKKGKPGKAYEIYGVRGS